MNSILIFASAADSKLRYVCDFIFREQLGLEWSLVDDFPFYKEAKSALKLYYGATDDSKYLSITEAGYFQNFDKAEIPEFGKNLNFVEGQSSFDLFAACFYLLARVEEYGEKSRDAHDRFQSSSSILTARGLLEYPVIDIWIKELISQLESFYSIELDRPQYGFTSTIDVDHLYAFKNKGLLLSSAATLKDIANLRIQKLKDRPKNSDPYDIFDLMISWHTERSIVPLFFLLTAERGKYDRSMDPAHPEFQKRAQQLAKYNLGIHPSYNSNSSSAVLQHEKQTLETLSNTTITKSRQHYLKLSFPHTYRNLLTAGITEDYTMGYPDRIGFRAGTSNSFLWYDLETDKPTALRVYPFCLMDVTLKNYLKLSPIEALAKAKIIIEKIKAVDGQAVIIWHNSSFYAGEGWGGWEKSYLQLLDAAVV